MIGLDVFKNFFKGFEDCYVVIGGSACTILFDDAGLSFRVTKDIDMVIIAENLSEEFAKKFWEFIKFGRYSVIYKSEENHKFYRFEKPLNKECPKMIELFSRNVNMIPLDNNTHLIPLHIADDISSLSAILLNDDYYYFLKNGHKVVDGISVLDEIHLIPFKAKAWCELTERQEQGEVGLSKHIKKHKYDIAQLLNLVARNQQITLEGQVYLDMMQFIIKMKDEEIIHPNLNKLTSKTFCERLSQLYNIKCDVFSSSIVL